MHDPHYYYLTQLLYTLPVSIRFRVNSALATSMFKFVQFFVCLLQLASITFYSKFYDIRIFSYLYVIGIFLSIQGFAHKDCDADGSWFRHPENNKTWSNYTTCINFDDFEVNKTHFNVNSESVAFALALVPCKLFYR